MNVEIRLILVVTGVVVATSPSMMGAMADVIGRLLIIGFGG